MHAPSTAALLMAWTASLPACLAAKLQSPASAPCPPCTSDGQAPHQNSVMAPVSTPRPSTASSSSAKVMMRVALSSLSKICRAEMAALAVAAPLPASPAPLPGCPAGPTRCGAASLRTSSASSCVNWASADRQRGATASGIKARQVLHFDTGSSAAAAAVAVAPAGSAHRRVEFQAR